MTSSPLQTEGSPRPAPQALFAWYVILAFAGFLLTAAGFVVLTRVLASKDGFTLSDVEGAVGPSRILTISGAVLSVASVVVFLLIIFRCWQALKAHSPNIRPGLYVALLLFPVVNLIWAFKAVAGVPIAFNRLQGRVPDLKKTPVINGFLVCAFLPMLPVLFITAQVLRPSGEMLFYGPIVLGAAATLISVLFIAEIIRPLAAVEEFNRTAQREDA